MKIRTAHITVAASRDAVFAFLSEPANLPAWATEFCERIERRHDGWIAHTAHGELRFAIESDAATGTIDMYSGPDATAMAVFPVRVLAMPPGVTLIAFTFFQAPDLPDEIYERQYGSLLVELRGLARRFGGGELHAPEGEAATAASQDAVA
jgi:hypothetical protein